MQHKNLKRLMMKKEYLIEIYYDVFDIASRIREIDSSYKLYYNTKLHRYELYSKRGLHENLELVCPYPCLDARFLNKTRQSRKEYAEKLIQQMERENEKITQANQKKILNHTQDKAKEMIKYADNKCRDVDFSDAYTTQWF